MNRVVNIRRPTQAGFTLVELLITVSIFAILIAVALPDLRAFLVNNRLSSDVNGFVGLINYARSEAIARNQSVVICPKRNGADGCESTQFWGEFEIQAFVDADGTNNFSAGDIRLKTIAATDPAGLERRINRVASSGGVISFGAVGFAQTPHRFDIFAIGDAAFEIRYGRTVCISRPGRVRVATANNACT